MRIMRSDGSHSHNSATTLSGGSNKSRSNRGQTLTSKYVWVGRAIFVVCLTAVAAVLGFNAHFYLTRSEQDLAETQFDSIADRALESALGIAKRKRLGTVLMASTASYANPDAERWPFVTMSGYEEIATHAIETSSGREMGFCPLVKPEQLEDFEAFAYDYYEHKRQPPFPNGTAVSSFGKGVWGVNPALGTADNRYHETDGNTSYGSPNKIFTPILQHNAGPHKALMINLHFQEARGKVIDYLIDCSNDRSEALRTNSTAEKECISITDMLILTSQEEEPGPGALIMQPIFPANDPTVLVGMIASSIVWGEVLQNVFDAETSGVDCVLETETQVYTYHVKMGVASFKGEGDLHEVGYSQFRRDILLAGPGAGLFSEGSATYTLSLYPADELFQVYSTSNPRVATVGAVCIMIFTSLMFFLYDFFVRKDMTAKTSLLDAKRKFVRFVSHEVRTPLNSVCMGLMLMQEEIEASLNQDDRSCSDTADNSVSAHPEAASEDSSTPMDKNNNNTKASVTKIVTSMRNYPQQQGGRSIFEPPFSEVRTLMREDVAAWSYLAREVLNNAQSAVDVLNDLLNYDKVEMEALTLELSVISIWNLIERTTNEFRIPAKNNDVNFKLEFGPLTAQAGKGVSFATDTSTLQPYFTQNKAIGDSFRIAQVLRNLVSNALKFTPEEGEVTIQAKWIKPTTKTSKGNSTKRFFLNNGTEVDLESSGSLEVSVHDTGAGMTKEQCKKLFSAGVQFNVNTLQAGGGSGLGLFIAKGIMEQHGGTLTVDSEGLGKGSTFTMAMPLYHVPDKELPPKESTYDVQPMAKLHREPSRLRILVVDDSTTNRKLLSRLLQNHGHYCDQADDGQTAIAQVVNDSRLGNSYDTILLDYEMPGMNGPLACKELRKLGNDSFIVGITGNVLPEDVVHFKECGANAVLPKPFQFANLEDLWVEYDVHGRATPSEV